MENLYDARFITIMNLIQHAIHAKYQNCVIIVTYLYCVVLQYRIFHYFFGPSYNIFTYIAIKFHTVRRVITFYLLQKFEPSRFTSMVARIKQDN